jgi:tripartite-type tricarboxylate transporter receptor subunit TctC
MKLPRRNFLRLAAGAAALPAVSRSARAQDYPSRPVRITSAFPLAVGRPGAGSNIATEAVVRAPADGYTLLLVTAPNAINATILGRTHP